MEQASTIGLDIAKLVFQVHGTVLHGPSGGRGMPVGVGAWRRAGSLEPSSPAMSLACRSSTIPPAVTASQGSAGG